MMKKSTLLLASTLGLVGISSTAFAGPSAATSDKKWELTLVGSGSSDKDFDSTAVTASGQVGYYFNDQIQVNLRQGFSFYDYDGGGSDFSGATAIGVDYHFDFGQDQRVIPFVGAAIGYRYGDNVHDTGTASVEGGVKWYVNDSTFIFGQVAYNWLFDDGDFEEDGFWGYSLGIGFRW